jgi:hypothetical protein
VEQQRPHTLTKSLEERLARVNAVCKKFLRDKASKQAQLKRSELDADLEALTNKYSKIVE